MKTRIVLPTMMFFCHILLSGQAMAVPFGGIEFPKGASSFADAVIKYDPLFSGGPAPTAATFIVPGVAVGIPDYVSPIGSVSLGRGGLLELAFTNNVLTNSGDMGDDLHIFEIGPDVEDTFVAIRPTASTLLLLDPLDDANGDGFFEIGKVLGSISSIDIDFFFPGFLAGVLVFDAVQLVDDFLEGASTGATVGADIDAVGAISSITVDVPEPSTLFLFLFGIVGYTFLTAKNSVHRI